MIEDPQENKWRASKVYLHPRRDFREVETWKWIIEQGIDIYARNDLALIYASANGHLEIVKFLVEKEQIFLYFSNGHLEVIEYLKSIIMKEKNLKPELIILVL